jgi:rod shape-determining protein MreD
MLFWMLLFLSMLTAMLTQALLPGPALLGGARFPVLLGVVLYYALNHKPWIVIIVAFAAGVLQDGLSLVPLGYSALLFCTAAFMAGRYRKLVLSEAAVTAAFFGGVTNLTVALILYVLLSRDGSIVCSGGAAALRIVGSGILGVVAVPAVFVLMTQLHRALDLVEEEGVDVKA